MVLQVGHPYTLNKIELAVSRSGYMSAGTVPSIGDFHEQKNIISNIPVNENTLMRAFGYNRLWSNKAMKISSKVIKETDEHKPVL